MSRLWIIVVALTGMIAFAGGGCASPSQGEKTVESFAKTRQTLVDAQHAVDGTLISLHRLRQVPGDAVAGQFRQYKESVDGLEKAASDAEWIGKGMREQGDSQMQAWEEEMKSIKDPTIKGTVASRQAAVRSNYKIVRMYAEDARKAYLPYIQGNKDMVKALSIDLTPAAVTSLSPAIDKVLLDGDALKQKLWLMQNAMNNMANGVSPLGQ
jgi:hypothetical protein